MGINYNTLMSRSEEFLRRRRSQRGHPEVMAELATRSLFCDSISLSSLRGEPLSLSLIMICRLLGFVKR
jgi:hypothetical protein